MATEAIDFTGIDSAAESDQTGSAAAAQDQDVAVEGQAAQDGHEPSESQPGEQADGRRGPANIRNSIKAASEALPEQAQAFKELGNAYFREQAYKQHFATPQEAGHAKQLIDGIGGVDGISNLQEMSQTYEMQDEFLREGNPEVLDDFAKDFPDGFAALAPSYLEKLSQVNPQAFSSAVVPYAMGMLENAGLGNHLAAILNEPDAARAKQMVQQLSQWYAQQVNGVQELRRSAPQNNPAQDRIAQQQTELEEQRNQLFSEGVQGKVNAAVNPEIQKIVDQYAKQYKLNDTQKMHFQNSLQQRVVQEMNADETYKKQVDLRKSNKARTHDSVGSYIASEFNRRLKDAAFATAKDIYGVPRGTAQAGTGVVKAGTPKTAPSGGPLFVSQRPPDSQLDLNRPNADMLLIQGRGYTKDGRFVTWRRPS